MKHLFETLSQPSAPPATTYTVYHLIEQSSLPKLSILRCCGPFKVPDLLNQIVLLVTELLILCSVGLEVAQELHKFGLVLQQYVQHWLSLVGVCNEYLLKKDRDIIRTDKLKSFILKSDHNLRQNFRLQYLFRYFKIIIEQISSKKICRISCSTSIINTFFFLAHLEDMERFKLDVSAVVSQHVHHQLQVLCPTDVFCHDSEVVSIQEKFPKELKNYTDLNKNLVKFKQSEHTSYT